MQILEELHCTKWTELFSPDFQSKSTLALENGKVLYLPKLTFQLMPHEEKFLTPDCAHPRAKNICYNSAADTLHGMSCQGSDYEELKGMLKRFSSEAHGLVKQLFSSYVTSLKVGRTSFRPVEIAGRKTTYRKDDTRLHVDAFPSAPNQGQRILRVFSNINPHGQARQWRLGEPFSDIAQRFLPMISKPFMGSAHLLKALKITKSYRTQYDHIMLQIHNKMKADLTYQQSSPQIAMAFPSGSSWIVQTDHVSHAAMSGQYVLEQTFYLPILAMKNPDLSPLRVLEKLTKQSLIARS
jgi:hypothetical protein